jgi:hypothetical protein
MDQFFVTFYVSVILPPYRKKFPLFFEVLGKTPNRQVSDFKWNFFCNGEKKISFEKVKINGH